jgi:hypothetical protein
MIYEEKEKAKENVINGICHEQNGWLYISVNGTPLERGYAYGYYCASEFKKIQEMLKHMIYEDTGKTWDYFIGIARDYFKENAEKDFPEFYQEIIGIARGCCAGGTETTVDEILAWNNYFTIVDSWYNTQSVGPTSRKEGGGGGKGGGGNGGGSDRCSAFIAVGDYTKDGKIVVAHNSFSNFIDGQFMRIILDINPDKGHRFIMQTSACWIWSGSDFFVTAAGIIGTETTIGGFIPYENNFPIGFRIRKAMQYGNNFNDYESILLKGNSGDYANSWLFGDINTNKIMRIELGLKYYNTEIKDNGFFIGFNSTYDPRIRNEECANSGFNDIRRHQGARKVRLEDLMEKHRGKIDVNIAKKIISDHYDVYLNKVNPCSRTVCSHYELDAREYMSEPGRPLPFQPRGAVDGCICSSDEARKMSFWAKYGSSCNIPFNSKKFFNKHRQWKNQAPFVFDRPNQPWTLFSVLPNSPNSLISPSKKTKTKKMKTKKTKTKKVKKVRFNI